MALIEAVATVLSKYVTIWPIVMDERSAWNLYMYWWPMASECNGLCDKLREKLQRNARVR